MRCDNVFIKRIKDFLDENLELFDNELYYDEFKKIAMNTLRLAEREVLDSMIKSSGVKISVLSDNRESQELTCLEQFRKEIVLYSADKGIKIDTLADLQKTMCEYISHIAVDYENEEILVVLWSKRTYPFWENDKQKELFEQYSNKTREKAEKGDFKDLIHFIMYHSVEKICEKDKEEMIRWRREKQEKKNPSCSEVLGCFTNNQVWLCGELIENKAKEVAKEYAVKLWGELKTNFVLFEKSIIELLYEKVFTHEFGHLVFDWTNAPKGEIREKQANYFSSYITDGEKDGFIVDFTKRQPKEYHNPYLIGDSRVDNLYKGSL